VDCDVCAPISVHYVRHDSFVILDYWFDSLLLLLYTLSENVHNWFCRHVHLTTSYLVYIAICGSFPSNYHHIALIKLPIHCFLFVDKLIMLTTKLTVIVQWRILVTKFDNKTKYSKQQAIQLLSSYNHSNNTNIIYIATSSI